MRTREVSCKTILGKSKLADYCLNPYTGCANACLYCYADFMRRFTDHSETWGEFVDAKVNAPSVLARELRRAKPGAHVVISSVCDAYQKAEEEYRITRRCLSMLLDVGLSVSVLTKSALVARDFDLMEGKENVRVEVSLSTMDEKLAALLEPGASPPVERVAVLMEAKEREIRRGAFLGPLMPGVADTHETMAPLFEAIAPTEPEQILVDSLTLYTGVRRRLRRHLRGRPDLLGPIERVANSRAARDEYDSRLRHVATDLAREYGLTAALRLIV